MLLLNPQNYAREHADLRSKEIMLKTITFFESKGLAAIKNDDQNMIWYQDVLDFVRDEGTFATLLTPAGYGAPDSRFDLRRVCEYNEILAFYSLAYQYAYQVSILGLGPIWMGSNEEIKHKTAQLLQQGGIFAFGLSEREHGADLYSTETTLFPDGAGAYRALDPLAQQVLPHAGELAVILQEILAVDRQPVADGGRLGRLQVGERHADVVGLCLDPAGIVPEAASIGSLLRTWPHSGYSCQMLCSARNWLISVCSVTSLAK